MLCELIQDITNIQTYSTINATDSIFHKYKLGLVSESAPFRLFETNCSTSCDDDSDSDDQSDQKIRGPYRKYSFQQKMQAVERILAGEDVKVVSKLFGIPRRNLLRWKKNGCERKEGGGRPTDSQMERVIYDKIKNQELTDEKQIRKFAIQYSKATSFKASKGWFVKFCLRFNLCFGNDKNQSPEQFENELIFA